MLVLFVLEFYCFVTDWHNWRMYNTLSLTKVVICIYMSQDQDLVEIVTF